nr:hypothetical protein Iba_chr07cCG15010 [Ipomoea batatas]
MLSDQTPQAHPVLVPVSPPALTNRAKQTNVIGPSSHSGLLPRLHILRLGSSSRRRVNYNYVVVISFPGRRQRDFVEIDVERQSSIRTGRLHFLLNQNQLRAPIPVNSLRHINKHYMRSARKRKGYREREKVPKRNGGWVFSKMEKSEDRGAGGATWWVLRFGFGRK